MAVTICLAAGATLGVGGTSLILLTGGVGSSDALVVNDLVAAAGLSAFTNDVFESGKTTGAGISCGFAAGLLMTTEDFVALISLARSKLLGEVIFAVSTTTGAALLTRLFAVGSSCVFGITD